MGATCWSHACVHPKKFRLFTFNIQVTVLWKHAFLYCKEYCKDHWPCCIILIVIYQLSYHRVKIMLNIYKKLITISLILTAPHMKRSKHERWVQSYLILSLITLYMVLSFFLTRRNCRNYLLFPLVQAISWFLKSKKHRSEISHILCSCLPNWTILRYKKQEIAFVYAKKNGVILKFS